MLALEKDMVSKILSIKPNTDKTVDVTFFDGQVKKVDAAEISHSKKIREAVADNNIFNTALIDNQRANIVWANGAKLDADLIMSEGTLIEIVRVDDIAASFADRLYKYREMISMTQKELSEITGISQADISRIERGMSNVSMSTMIRLMDGVGKKVDFSYSAKEFNRYENMAIPSGVNLFADGKKQGEFTLFDIYNAPEDDRYELIDGVIYSQAAPSFIHQHIISAVHFTLQSYIVAHNGECIVLESPIGVQFEHNDKDYLEPDLVVLCDKGKIRTNGIIGAPDFVLEVTSPSTKMQDYTTKLNIYAREGVKEYWIIDPEKRSIVKYDFSIDAMPEIHFFNEDIPVNLYDGKCIVNLKEFEE